MYLNRNYVDAAEYIVNKCSSILYLNNLKSKYTKDLNHDIRIMLQSIYFEYYSHNMNIINYEDGNPWIS